MPEPATDGQLAVQAAVDSYTRHFKAENRSPGFRNAAIASAGVR